MAMREETKMKRETRLQRTFRPTRDLRVRETGTRGASRLARAAGAFLLVALVAWGAAPRGAAAQPGSAEREARLTALFSNMSVDTGVRVSTSMVYIERGSFRGVGEENVRIEQGGEVVPVPLADIRSVEVEEHHPIEGMLWGLGAGLLAGSVSGLLVGSFYCDDPVGDCTEEEKRGALIGGSALGAAGGIAGFLIGKYRVSWQPVFP